nr:ankyrin-2-like isoform X2 [Megalopta genalis]
MADDTTAFLRAARSGNLEKVVEFLDTDLDINTANSNGLNALHLASKDGHVEIVTELLKRGAKVDAATKKGNTALHIASLAGQEEIVNILIQYGAAVNIQSQNGFTPLYMAAQENHDQVVKVLLSNGANQSLATEDGFTPLAVAMQQGHDKVVSVLLENDSKGKVRLPALHIAAKKNDCKAADLLLQNDHKPDVTSKSGFTPLHIASHYGYEEIARLLIKRGADVNYLAKHNISPLHVAAKWGKNNMVKVLLENSAQIDAKTRDGLTPLHCAARSGHEQVIITLLEHSAPISARTKNGLAPLHMASQGDHVDAARVLLYHRAPVDEVTIDYLTSLHVAAHCGHVRVAKLLLDRKADPNARALNGFTPLHIACKKNKIKVVELLLKHGASIESTTESGLTPLHVASFMGCMNIVIFLLQHEANPDVPTVRGETPLHLAARANQTDIIRILLRNGAKVDARAREQQTPLHIASRLGNIDIVMLLLQHGAAVDTTTKDMYTALHIASKEGQEEVAAILVENNASLNATTKNGFTPLHIAAKYGNMSVAKILLQRNSVLDVQGKNDISPLHLACHYDHPNVANLLLEKGASPHLASQNGHTPLHIAAHKNQMDIASTLLENGANANAESKAGFTPLHLSAQKGHYDMTNLLIEHGADPNHKSKNGLTALHLCAQEDFIRVASILVKNGANVESETETGYRPIHVAAHFGNLSMIRFLLKHNADINVKTNQSYTPLHQAAQQGHAHIVTALLEGNASHKARTNDGLSALNIAQKLGYISVTEVLKGLPYDTLIIKVPDNVNCVEKYRVIAPESLQETSFMSDSDDEGGSDALISEQPYRYLTADLMKSLRDDSLPIDVTRDDPIHRQVIKEGKQEFTQSNNYCLAENFDTEGYNLGRLHFRSFLVSFLVDARGGAMRGCRHSGVRIIVPPRRATMPIRVTCRLVKPSKVANPPPLMEGEALATRIIEMGPVGVTFLGPVLIDIPHFASIQGKGREIIILRSENGETWKEHDNSVDNDDTLLNTPYDTQMSATHSGRITRILTTDFPQYFATVTRIKQEVHVIGAEGGILISSVANHVQAVFPPGALTKKIKVGLQAHVIPAELTAKLLGNCVAVSPVITIEPRRRKFHKPITLTIPVPEAANKGMINQYGGETPTLRLLCSIAGGTSESQWEDVTGSTPLTFMNDRVSFTTTVSARFWLMDCRNIGAVSKMATELYEESLYVPYIINFVIYTKRTDIFEATLRILCMTDGKEGMHTLERQEEFVEIVKSRDVEALDGKDLYIEFSGNLVPVTKSGVQLKFTFKAFRQNRLSFHVKVKDPMLDPVARMLFMREPKVAKGEPPQQPICVLNIVLPESTAKLDDTKKLKEYEDSNIINQKLDTYESKYKGEQTEKSDDLRETSPSEKKFITDTLQKERTDAVTIHESLAQKAASPLESVDASYPSKVVGQEQDLSPTVERQTYSEKRKFWEDISRKRESYQRSESDVSRTSELTVNESDSLYVTQNVATDGTTDAVPQIEKSETMEDLNVPDISECSVAEKAHYFEEQIQKEISKIPARAAQQQPAGRSEKEKTVERSDDDRAEKEEDEGAETYDETKEKIDEPEKQKTEEKEMDVSREEQVMTKVREMMKEEERKVIDRRLEEVGKKLEVVKEIAVKKEDAERALKEETSWLEKEHEEEAIMEQETVAAAKKRREVAEKEKEEEMKERKIVVEEIKQEKVEKIVQVAKEVEKEQEEEVKEIEEEFVKKAEKRQKEVKKVVVQAPVIITEKEREEVEKIVKEESVKFVEKIQEEAIIKLETVKVTEKREEVKEIVKEKPVKEAPMKEEVKEIVEEEPAKEAPKEEVIKIVIEEPAKEVPKKEGVKEIVKEEPAKEEEVKEIVEEESAKEAPKEEEVKEIVEEESAKEAPKEEEVKEIVKEKPAKEAPKEEEVKEIVEEESAKEAPKEEEVKEIVEEKPAKEAPKEEEVKEIVKEEPAKEAPKEEEVKEIVKEKSAKEAPMKEEVKEIVEEEPAKKAPKEEEVKEIVVKEPAKEAPKEEEVKEIVKEKSAKEAPMKEEVKEIVEEEPAKKAPKEEEVKEIVVKEPAKEAPKKEEVQEVVKEEPTEEAPKKEEIKEIIKEEPAKEAPKEEVKVIVKEEPMKVTVETKQEVVEEVKEEPAKVAEEQPEEIAEMVEEAKVVDQKEERIEKARKPEDKVTDRRMEKVVSEIKVEPSITTQEVIKARSGGKRIITEETTIIYKVQKDGSLVQEQVTKSVQIGDETGKMQTISDVTQESDGTELFEMISAEDIRAMQLQDEIERAAVAAGETKESEEVSEVKQAKKESRIPISTSMMDKSKKETKVKLSPDAKPAGKDSPKDVSPEKPEATMAPKKKEFESQIPKRVVETKPAERKDTHVRKESGTYTITEKKSSEEVTSKLEQHSTTKSETQTFSKTFADPQEAFRMFEGNGKPDYSTVTSKIDQKSSSMLEKKEVKSSEIQTGTDKLITHEEKEQIERKKSSESQLRKESPTETVEEKKSKREELDKVAVQRMSMNLTDKEEVIDASASESQARTKEEKTFKKLSDEEGVTTHEAGSSSTRESDADVAIRIKKDVSEAAGDDVKLIEEPVQDSPRVEKLAHAESHKETKESFEVTEFEPKLPKKQREEEAPEPETMSLEELQIQKFKEIEARTIAETLIQEIEEEAAAKSAETRLQGLLTKLEEMIEGGPETVDEKLADKQTLRFENIMKRQAEKEADRTRASFQEESFEKSSTRDSFSEDISKDEEKEESYPLSSSQARQLDRDITMSPSSMSEQIDFEETMDVDTNELEDLSKLTLSQSEKQDRSGKDGEKIVCEGSGARVLEILEPAADSQSRQDSVDVPSLETDEHKISEQTSRGISSLRDIDSFEKTARSRDITVSEDTNVDSSLVQEGLPLEKLKEPKRTDSFEIDSPPMMSPKLKVQDLEIKPVSWMIGEKKIEISETLQPSQIFNQELEEYETMRKRLTSQDESVDLEQESGTKSSEEVSVIESAKEADAKAGKSEQDFDSEMVENKLDVSLQELVDMLQRENDEKASIEEYSSSQQEKKEGVAAMEDDKVEESTEKGSEEVSEKEQRSEEIKEQKSEDTEEVEESKAEEDSKEVDRAAVSKPDVELKLEKSTPLMDTEKKPAAKSDEETEEKPGEETEEKPGEETEEKPGEEAAGQDDRTKDELKAWTDTYVSKMKLFINEYKRHVEKTTEKHEKSGGKSSTVPSDTTCALKIKKDYYPSVDLSARYAITVLDQVVKKEIAEVKESLEAAKQDLIEELSENSETVIQIKDSPSEFQFMLQPESIPNDLPLLYKPPSPDRDRDRDPETLKSSDSPQPSQLQPPEEPARSESKDGTEPKSTYDSPFSSFEEPILGREPTPVIVTERSDSAGTVQDDSRDDEEERPSPILASRSGSDVDNKDESSSLALPRPVLRRRHKPSRAAKRVASESDADIGSSSGDSSNYQSCDYEQGSGSRPSSSDMEALHSCGAASATVSEYETAVMSMESTSKPTSQEYHTAATTMSSRESMKSLASLSSGHLGSIDSTSEMSETLVASEADDKDDAEDMKLGLEDERTEQSDSSSSDNIPVDESTDKIDSHIPYRMKRSSEMIFPQVLEGDAAPEDRAEPVAKDEELPAKGVVDSATSTTASSPRPDVRPISVDIMTARVSEDGVQSVCTQVSSVQPAETTPERKVSDPDTLEKDLETVSDSQTAEFPELKRALSIESPELSMQASTPSIAHQTSMSTSSTSGVSVSTVVGTEKLDRRSPDSDSFEVVDKPDIIDDFFVVEEVGREAEEFDSEGKSIRISSMPQVSSKNFDRELEHLITETKEDVHVSGGGSSSQPAKKDDLFDFESEESPPQASNDDQYSQSYSDEEQYEGSKKWIEMQFHQDARGYDIEYDRGPLEDIKEEEITDFEAGSSRFGSLGSHKESIGSVGSMRGSFGSTPDYDVLAGKKYFVRPSDHDNVSLSSLQEFEHLESAVAAENSKKLQQCGSHDSVNNGSLPRRYTASRSGHGDDVSLSSLKDFEGLEKACREAHLIELRAREEEDLLEHESPENKYKLESLRARVDTSAAGSFNPSTSGSDDYEKRIKEIDEIIRIAQTNVERFDRQDDTTEDISQIEIMDTEKTGPPPPPLVPASQVPLKQEEPKDPKDGNVMETSTDSLELEDNMDKKHHPLCRSSDSLEMKTTLDFPSLSSDSLNNVRDGKETQQDVVGYANNLRRISSDSLDMPLVDPQAAEAQARVEPDPAEEPPSDNSLDQGPDSDSNVRTDKTRTTPSSGT